jgi:peptide-methionine (S)-S-oxide reductase
LWQGRLDDQLESGVAGGNWNDIRHAFYIWKKGLKLLRGGLELQIRKGGTMELATFGAGCFWGVEETFRKLPGVKATAVGYEGGPLKNPTYEDVCTDLSGHAEVVQIEFDPALISFDKLLDVFFVSHNPTTLNRQGPDIGTQYRSVVFFHSAQQQAAAEAAKKRWEASGKFKKPIVTQIVPSETFYPAEEYHQKYLMKRGLGSCHVDPGI